MDWIKRMLTIPVEDPDHPSNSNVRSSTTSTNSATTSTTTHKQQHHQAVVDVWDSGYMHPIIDDVAAHHSHDTSKHEKEILAGKRNQNDDQQVFQLSPAEQASCVELGITESLMEFVSEMGM